MSKQYTFSGKMSVSKGKNWEGLGGPVRFTVSSNPKSSDDPTLDACCQRDIEEQRIGLALRSTLQKYDIVAERERRRRHSVILNQGSLSRDGLVVANKDHGCRCSYDPNSDGGEYRALIELRMKRQQQQFHSDNDESEILSSYDEVVDEKKVGERDKFDLHRFDESTKSKTIEKNDSNTDDDIVDDDDDEYDYLLEDDLPSDTVESIKLYEERRRAELDWEVLQNEIAMLHGYGIHRQIHPQRVLHVAGLHQANRHEGMLLPNVVLHLVDSDSMGSASLDLFLEQLAPKYRGTIFIRSSGRATILLNSNLFHNVLPMFHSSHSSSSVDNDLPALIAIRDGVPIHACIQLKGLINNADNEVDTSAVFHWLNRSGVLRSDRPTYMDQICRMRPEEEALFDSCSLEIQKHRARGAQEEERYDCGRDGCIKTFPHEHIGEKNEKQDGLLISEAAILDNANST